MIAAIGLLTQVFYGTVGFIGAILTWLGIDLLMCWYRYRKSRKWCEERHLEMRRVDLPGGKYGYIGYDFTNMRVYGIPNDYGEADESRSCGLRMQEFDWKGKDKVALDEDGNEVRI